MKNLQAGFYINCSDTDNVEFHIRNLYSLNHLNNFKIFKYRLFIFPYLKGCEEPSVLSTFVMLSSLVDNAKRHVDKVPQG